MAEEPEVTEPVVVEPVEPEAPVGDPPVEPQMISRGVLPVELRDQEPDKVELYLTAMRQGLTTKQAEVDQLSRDLDEANARAIPAHAVPDVVEPTEEMPKEELQALILDDPEKALDYYAERKFGPAFRNLGMSAGEGIYAAAFQRWSDFGEVEATVRDMVTRSGQIPSAGLIETAYTAAQGMIRIQEKKDTLAKASVSLKPSAPVAEEPRPTLSRLEADIAAAQGMTKEEWIEFRDESMSEIVMEVPLG